MKTCWRLIGCIAISWPVVSQTQPQGTIPGFEGEARRVDPSETLEIAIPRGITRRSGDEITLDQGVYAILQRVESLEEISPGEGTQFLTAAGELSPEGADLVVEGAIDLSVRMAQTSSASRDRFCRNAHNSIASELALMSRLEASDALMQRVRQTAARDMERSLSPADYTKLARLARRIAQSSTITSTDWRTYFEGNEDGIDRRAMVELICGPVP